MNLVKRILVTLLKLLLDKLNPLVPSKPGILLLNLRQPPRLKCRIRSLESALGVAIDLAGVPARQRERIERVVDTSGVQGRLGLGAGRVVVELG